MASPVILPPASQSASHADLCAAKSSAIEASATELTATKEGAAVTIRKATAKHEQLQAKLEGEHAIELQARTTAIQREVCGQLQEPVMAFWLSPTRPLAGTIGNILREGNTRSELLCGHPLDPFTLAHAMATCSVSTATSRIEQWITVDPHADLFSGLAQSIDELQRALRGSDLLALHSAVLAVESSVARRAAMTTNNPPDPDAAQKWDCVRYLGSRHAAAEALAKIDSPRKAAVAEEACSRAVAYQQQQAEHHQRTGLGWMLHKAGIT